MVDTLVPVYSFKSSVTAFVLIITNLTYVQIIITRTSFLKTQSTNVYFFKFYFQYNTSIIIKKTNDIRYIKYIIYTIY